RDILPKGGSRLRPGRATVTFGRPLRADPGLGASAAARELAARLEREIAALADEQTTDWWTARRRAAAGSTPALTGPDVGAWRRSWALGAKSEQKRANRQWTRPGRVGGRDWWRSG
ncbi:MAG TPA: hypothetical protein VFV02_06980, partial [Acidimicrobiales bacterium]|nr:hypothetical protein [Acidimicrobiales bacterium]